MGNCTYCGQPAGFLRSQHADCAQKHVQAGNEIKDLVCTAVQTNGRTAAFQSGLRAITGRTGITSADAERMVIEGWGHAVERFLDDGVISTDEEARLMRFAQDAGVLGRIQQHSAYERIVKAAVLRDVAAGQIKSRVTVTGGVPINLQKGEVVLWAFKDTEYLEDRERREFVGRSQGVSIRLAKGVYYRVGAFKGHPVSRQERVSLGQGTLFVTDKNLYFTGPQKTVRVPYTKIVAFERFSDGIGIVRDGATAKPQIFVTGDGWFSCNLITGLASR